MDFLNKPSTDFAAVRDGRNSLPLWMDIDLTSARSIAAGNALSINIAGNSFYVDQDTANVGNATVHFQDTNLGATSAPLFVSAGFVANVPFTQILIENTAQAGKRLRIFYGVDINFQAGINASISISGTVSVNNPLSVRPETGAVYYAENTPLAANTAVQVCAPAANVNGLIVTAGHSFSLNATSIPTCALIAKASAPANVIDGQIIFASKNYMGGSFHVAGELPKDIFVPAGKGLYFICNYAEAIGIHSCAYKLL